MTEQVNDLNIESNEDLPLTENGEAPKDDPRFKEGQILRFVRVRFPGNARSFPFLINKRKINYGQKVVAMSDRGIAVGYVNSFPYEVPFTQEMLPIRSINKVATEEDILKEIETYKHEKKVETLCNDLITKYNLEMTLTHVEFTQFGKKAVFYFIAPARVDFRDLVKDLVNELKMRIELRQISVRDRSASVGGIGPCGRELCCSSFLSKYGAVNVKMAKNQDLTINYSKLNGVCGQLKCCLQYEDEVYAEKRKKLPEEGAVIETYTGEIGVVRRLNILSEQFDILTTSGVIKRFVVEEFKDYRDDFKMPEQFDHITDETKTINGLERSTNLKEKNKEHDRVKAENRGKEFAKKAFTEIFGAETLDYSLPEVAELLSSKAVPMKNLEEELPAHINKDEDFEDLEPQTQPQKTNPQNNNNNHNHNRNNNNRNRNNNRNHNRR